MNEDLEAAIDSLTTYKKLTPGDDARMAEELLATLRKTLTQKSRQS
jgi:hypothetical protein